MKSLDQPSSNIRRRYQAIKAAPGIDKADLETKLNDEGVKGWEYVGPIHLGTNNWMIFSRIRKDNE